MTSIMLDDEACTTELLIIVVVLGFVVVLEPVEVLSELDACNTEKQNFD